MVVAGVTSETEWCVAVAVSETVVLLSLAAAELTGALVKVADASAVATELVLA